MVAGALPPESSQIMVAFYYILHKRHSFWPVVNNMLMSYVCKCVNSWSVSRVSAFCIPHSRLVLIVSANYLAWFVIWVQFIEDNTVLSVVAGEMDSG